MPSDAPAWSLHSQLKKDTIDIGDLPLCRVLVIKDANFPWLLLVPRRADVVEIIDLDEVEQAQLMTEISRVARALKEVTRCDKLNIAALGNVVPQLHVHIIARRAGAEKLFALEGQQNSRAYVVYRDSLVVKQDEGGPRALLSIKEALGFGAN